MLRGSSLIAVASILLLVGCGSSEPTRSSTSSPLAPVTLSGPAAGLAEAVLMESIAPRWGPRPDGPELLTDWGEQVSTLDAGRRVVVLGDPILGPNGNWVRVWVPPDEQVYLGDFFGWLPTTRDGRATLRPQPPPSCPAVATIETLAPLLPPDRWLCVGRSTITIDARTWNAGTVPNYDVTPAWYGTNANTETIVSLFSPGPSTVGPGESRRPSQAGSWIDARVPPGVERPPSDMLVRVTGHFGDPSADGCTRALNRVGWNPPPPVGAGFPPEAATDSVEWCREQFVVSGWEIVAGPEGRSIDRSNPQLHRTAVQGGPQFACGGVGMPPLRVRIDPTRADPVWIETGPNTHILAFFGQDFRLILDPPRVVGPGNVVLVDGEIVDPDRGKPGLAVCPEGESVTFVRAVDSAPAAPGRFGDQASPKIR